MSPAQAKTAEHAYHSRSNIIRELRPSGSEIEAMSVRMASSTAEFNSSSS